jgi:hypothetical protein
MLQWRTLSQVRWATSRNHSFTVWRSAVANARLYCRRPPQFLAFLAPIVPEVACAGLQ